jgi:hypothetical protein
MDALAAAPHHASVRVLTHIKKLDDYFGDCEADGAFQRIHTNVPPYSD